MLPTERAPSLYFQNQKCSLVMEHKFCGLLQWPSNFNYHVLAAQVYMYIVVSNKFWV